jgi:hypothetical protein
MVRVLEFKLCSDILIHDCSVRKILLVDDDADDNDNRLKNQLTEHFLLPVVYESRIKQ